MTESAAPRRQYVEGSTEPGTGEYISTTTGYLQSSETLKVHAVTCPGLRNRWNLWMLPWSPPGEQFDEACRRCLPDGLPTG